MCALSWFVGRALTEANFDEFVGSNHLQREIMVWRESYGFGERADPAHQGQGYLAVPTGFVDEDVEPKPSARVIER